MKSLFSCPTGNSVRGNTCRFRSQRSISRQIDKSLVNDKKNEAKVIKLLLLGGSESGKSTFAKQMKILHMNGFNEHELEYYRHLIYYNCLEGMILILDAMVKLKIRKLVPNNFEETVKVIQKLKESNEWLPETVSTFVVVAEQFWKTEAVQETFDRHDEYYLPDNVPYFMSHIKRICALDYMPDYDDILHSRIITTGIVEMEFHYKNVRFRLVDIGGQRSQRRKWIHCFDNVTAILFLVALSEYDMTLAEDPSMNRMHDSLHMFHAITTNQIFAPTPAVLFLNKKDILEQKIKRSPLKVCFPEYSGSNEYTEVSEYINQQFLKVKPKDKNIYCNFTNATDTRNIDYVFDAAVDIIFTKNMMRSGLT